MIFNIFPMVYGTFLVFASILMGRSVTNAGLILCAVMLVTTWFSHKKSLLTRAIQLLLLVAFHRLSQLNWCEVMYISFSVKYLYETRRVAASGAMTVGLIGIYESIRFTYTHPNLYSLLGIAADMAGSLLVFAVFCYILRLQDEQRRLQIENKRLSRRDALTGLVDWQEFHRRVAQLVSDGRPFIVFLVDCANLMAMNHEHGFQKGNQVLQEVASCLNLAFPDAALIARYGGDQFGVVLVNTDFGQASSRFAEFVDGPLTDVVGVRCPYSSVLFPAHRQTKDSIIRVLEERLFEEKKTDWLVKEAQLFRSERMKVLGEIAASMAHEIRNPLTTVKGFLQVSRNHAFNIEPWFDLMVGEIDRVKTLTEEFLMFSKPLGTRFEICDLRNCVNKAYALLEPQTIFLLHHVPVETSPSELLVNADAEKIIQVLLNLVTNALEAMTEPGSVYVRAYQQETHAIVEVQDTGPGVPADSLNKVFQPFFTTKETGTGLGLYICQQIIHDHGGTITLENAPSGGARFAISLPLANHTTE